MLTLAQDAPPPWIPADTQHTTAGVSEQAELFMIRAVNTGVINCFPGRPRIRGESSSRAREGESGALRSEKSVQIKASTTP
ncbi:hypothetical protein FA13DRAFT_1724856 [Coprinellus micaceus]|uniref:Uncharacterized protein n=1 Tax=Coprinellus micaceus TaxID=71717 RepID=A0A4Y7TYL0_COPMI|nr:hypothetical protein FA13DRAFT_1724856 [Coprinellus micaceus]